MRHVVIGAGAIGGALGGLLASSGSEVLLVARGAHAEAMRDRGVTLRCPDTRLVVEVPTITDPDDAVLRTDDVLVVATKTPQVDAAVEQWADRPVHDAAGAVVGTASEVLPVLTATNGVAAEDMALRRFRRVLAVCVWFPVVMAAPGELLVRTRAPRGVFHIGRYGGPPDADDAALLDALTDRWGAGELRVVAPEAVMAWKYRKLLSNLANALQALLGDAVGDAEDLREAAETEARSVLAEAGIAVTDDAEEARAREGLVVAAVPGEPAELGGSTWQSLRRGTGSVETDYLNGEIALVARRIGHTAPVNARLAALTRRAARDGARPGSITVEQLRESLLG